MRKIGDKEKKCLLKAYILFVFFCMLFMFFVGFQVESELKPEWETLYLIVIIIYVILVVIMVYLMKKIDISPSDVMPDVKSINAKDYSEFKEKIFQQAINQGFDEPNSLVLKEDGETTLAFRKNNGVTYVLQTIWMEELHTGVLDVATELFWEKTELYVGEDAIQSQTIGLMQCVCVQRLNGAMRKFTHQNVQQEYKRYQILAAISFGGRKAYICQTKGGFFRSYYRYLKREFDFITQTLWNESKK